MASTGTSKVIDALQRELDALRGDLLETRETLAETRHKCSILQKRNETMVEQLSNAKHQAEVAESMLKRKERRVVDLETQLTDSISSYDTVKFDHDKLKMALSTANKDRALHQHENERMEAAYQTLQTSFASYRATMGERIDHLSTLIPTFLAQREKILAENVALIKSEQPQLLESYAAMAKNGKRLEQLYSQKYERVNESLLVLANATKQHGQATAIVMDECEDVLKAMNRNEDLVLRVAQVPQGPLSDQAKISQLKKLRDISVLSDSTNLDNSNTFKRQPSTRRKKLHRPQSHASSSEDSFASQPRSQNKGRRRQQNV